MVRLLTLLALLVLGAAPLGAAERVNLVPGARVCDATDCFVLDTSAVSVTVWQTISDGSVQFQWKGALLTARAGLVDRDVQDCAWGTLKGERAFLCDGEPRAALAETAPRPKRRWQRRPEPEVVAALKSFGLYDRYYPAE